MFDKFYCKQCHQIKKRHQVKCVDGYYALTYYCRYCNNEVESVEDMLIRMSDEIDRNRSKRSLPVDLNEWIIKEALEKYPESIKKRKAFKDGIYTLLGKIGYDCRN